MRPASPVSSAGRSIVAWLTALQVMSALSALASVVVAAAPGLSGPASPGLNPLLGWALALVQVVVAAGTILALDVTKRWMNDVRTWNDGEGAPEPQAHARRTRALGVWLTVGQWLPVLGFALAVPLVWYATGVAADSALIEDQLRAQPGQPQLSPEALRALLPVVSVLSLLSIGVPSLVINGAVLGWIRRWMRAVSDAVLGLPARGDRLFELAGTLGRWFTFFQVLLGFLVLLILAAPLVGPVPGQTGAQIFSDRITLLLAFLQLALFLALLQWSKTFMFGVTTRVARDQQSAAGRIDEVR